MSWHFLARFNLLEGVNGYLEEVFAVFVAGLAGIYLDSVLFTFDITIGVRKSKTKY